MKPELEHVDPATLVPHPLNPRIGDVEAIRASIRAVGFYNYVVGQTSTGYVIAGNHRLKAAVAEGVPDVPVMWLDVDDDTALRILLADNRTSDKSEYYADILLTQLEALGDLAGTGYTGDDLDDLLAEVEGMQYAPEAEFYGSYAETDEERQARSRGGTSREASGLKDVVLVFNLDDYMTFAGAIAGIKRADKTLTTGLAVMEALRRCTT